MKKIWVLVLFFVGCGVNFPTRYDRIDNDRVRFPAFVYDNKGFAEGAPGDTVELRAYFAGEPQKTTKWTISTTVFLGSFGTDTFADTVSLQNFIIPGTYKEYSGGVSDSVVFSFAVPADIIRNKFNNIETIGSLIPADMRNSLPSEFLKLKPVEVINILNILSSAPLNIDSVSVDSILKVLTGDSTGSVREMFPVLLQIFSVTMRIFAVVNDEFKVESDFTVRYNSGLSYLGSAIPVNHNPVIDWVRLYKIRGSRRSFDITRDLSLVDSIYEMGGDDDTIFIEDGCSYFLVADSGTASIDRGVSLTSGSLSQEIFNYEWFYRNDDSFPDQKIDNLLVLQSIPGSNNTRLLPSVDKRMEHFSIWLVVYDSFFGERLRPVGFWFRGFRGVMRY